MMASQHANRFWLSSLAGTLLLWLDWFNDRRPIMLLIALIFPVAAAGCQVVNFTLARLLQHTVDAQMLQIDGGLSLVIYHWTTSHRLVWLLTDAVYKNIPLLMAVVLTDKGTKVRLMAKSLAVGSVMAPVFYCLVPAVGPGKTGDPLAARNCMPSLHFGWALIAVACSSRRMKWITVPFAIATAYATLGTGEHYWMDIVAAVPYTYLVLWACERSYERTGELELAAADWNRSS